MRQYALRLSSAASWVVCHAYPMMNKGRPEIEDDHTVREEGLACHWAAEKIHKGFVVPIGTVAPNNIAITEEMLDACDLYLDELRSWGCVPIVEKQMPAASIHAECGGTPDAWAALHRPTNARLLIKLADLKFGFKVVDPFENYQLSGYASAILDELKIDSHAEQFVDFEFVIVQPRAYGKDGAIRRWFVKATDLRAIWNIMHMSAEHAMSPNPIAKAGPQCEHCSARYDCDTLHKASMHSLEIAGQAQVLELPPAALDDELRRIEHAIEVLSARKTGLAAQAMFMLRNGESLPHWALENTQARVRWIEGAEGKVSALANLMGKNINKPPQLLTPTQASKIIDPSVVAQFSFRPHGETKLVPFSGSKARKVFG